MKIVVKGVHSPEDALAAVRAGVDGIWVSNHGARQVQHLSQPHPHPHPPLLLHSTCLPSPPTFCVPRAAAICFTQCPPACFAFRSNTPSHLFAPLRSSLRLPRQLDTVPATIEMLPDIVRAVAGRVEVYMDGGVTRGTDVMKVRSFEQWKALKPCVHPLKSFLNTPDRLVCTLPRRFVCRRWRWVPVRSSWAGRCCGAWPTVARRACTTS
jgi:hypothetical protein